MLRPSSVNLNVRLNSGPQNVDLGSSLTVNILLFPRVRVYNRANNPIRVIIEEVEDLGVSSNPLQNGAITTVRLDTTLYPVGSMLGKTLLWHDLSTPFLINPASPNSSSVKPVLLYTLKLQNLGQAPTVADICNVSVVGLFEETNPNASPNVGII